MFRLERPNVAINDPRVRRRFQMWRTWDITVNETREHIINRIVQVAAEVPGGKLRHVVFSCHGLPGFLLLGQGFNRRYLPMFEAWAGKVEKLWLPSCLIANIPTAARLAQYNADNPGWDISDGNVFCAELARRAHTYVVAATEDQCEFPRDVPLDRMTRFEGLAVCYDPRGRITWRTRNRSMWMRTAPDGSQQCVPMPE